MRFLYHGISASSHPSDCQSSYYILPRALSHSTQSTELRPARWPLRRVAAPETAFDVWALAVRDMETVAPCSAQRQPHLSWDGTDDSKHFARWGRAVVTQQDESVPVSSKFACVASPHVSTVGFTVHKLWASPMQSRCRQQRTARTYEFIQSHAAKVQRVKSSQLLVAQVEKKFKKETYHSNRFTPVICKQESQCLPKSVQLVELAAICEHRPECDGRADPCRSIFYYSAKRMNVPQLDLASALPKDCIPPRCVAPICRRTKPSSMMQQRLVPTTKSTFREIRSGSSDEGACHITLIASTPSFSPEHVASLSKYCRRAAHRPVSSHNESLTSEVFAVLAYVSPSPNVAPHEIVSCRKHDLRPLRRVDATTHETYRPRSLQAFVKRGSNMDVHGLCSPWWSECLTVGDFPTRVPGFGFTISSAAHDTVNSSESDKPMFDVIRSLCNVVHRLHDSQLPPEGVDEAETFDGERSLDAAIEYEIFCEDQRNAQLCEAGFLAVVHPLPIETRRQNWRRTLGASSRDDRESSTPVATAEDEDDLDDLYRTLRARCAKRQRGTSDCGGAEAPVQQKRRTQTAGDARSFISPLVHLFTRRRDSRCTVVWCPMFPMASCVEWLADTLHTILTSPCATVACVLVVGGSRLEAQSAKAVIYRQLKHDERALRCIEVADVSGFLSREESREDHNELIVLLEDAGRDSRAIEHCNQRAMFSQCLMLILASPGDSVLTLAPSSAAEFLYLHPHAVSMAAASACGPTAVAEAQLQAVLDETPSISSIHHVCHAYNLFATLTHNSGSTDFAHRPALTQSAGQVLHCVFALLRQEWMRESYHHLASWCKGVKLAYPRLGDALQASLARSAASEMLSLGIVRDLVRIWLSIRRQMQRDVLRKQSFDANERRIFDALFERLDDVQLILCSVSLVLHVADAVAADGAAYALHEARELMSRPFCVSIHESSSADEAADYQFPGAVVGTALSSSMVRNVGLCIRAEAVSCGALRLRREWIDAMCSTLMLDACVLACADDNRARVLSASLSASDSKVVVWTCAAASSATDWEDSDCELLHFFVHGSPVKRSAHGTSPSLGVVVCDASLVNSVVSWSARISSFFACSNLTLLLDDDESRHEGWIGMDASFARRCLEWPVHSLVPYCHT